MTKFNYKQAKQDLNEILEWFERPDIDFEEADLKYKQAHKIISDIDKYLNDKEQELKINIKK
mgnify:CR=1 FL=1